jgi:hypothetical protein
MGTVTDPGDTGELIKRIAGNYARVDPTGA